MKLKSFLALSRAIAGVFVLASVPLPGNAATGADTQTTLIAKGKYLAIAGDCVSCHTAKGGRAFAGGDPLETPFGAIWPPNITADRETGIGGWSDDQFYRAMHDGIGHDGENLYPAFPFPWFTRVTRSDVLAIKAYLMSQPAVKQANHPLEFSFPFNQREGLTAWRLLFFKPAADMPVGGASSEAARGAYLVDGLGHCGECHNSGKLTGASAWSGHLQGGSIDDWYAPGLNGGQQSMGRWSVPDLVTYLKTGAAPGKGVVVGPMGETIKNSLSQLTDSDLHAVAIYLKSLPANSDEHPVELADYAGHDAPGAKAYLDHCAFCHRVDGQGRKGAIPALAGNKTVTVQGPENVIRVVLGGLPSGHGFAPMPAVGAGMTDDEIAQVTNYVRQSWGNAAPANAEAGMVGQLRGKTETMLAANETGGCSAISDQRVADAVNQPPVKAVLTDATQTGLYERVGAVIRSVKSSDPNASDDQITQALTAAYCPVVAAGGLSQAARAERIGNFSSAVWGALQHGKNPG